MLKKTLPYKPVTQPVRTAQPNVQAGVVQRRAPVAPPAYRPLPTPRVLQTKPSLNKGPIATHQQRAVTPQIARPGAPAVKTVAPKVYRPNPTPQVLQRRTAIQAAVQRPPVQMKAQTPVRPLPANPSVLQRKVVIRDFKTHGRVEFKIKKSTIEGKLNTADTLIAELNNKGLGRGWIGALREMVGDKKKIYKYDTIDKLVEDLAEDFPLMKESKKRKREERREIEDAHRTNQRNVRRKIVPKGKALRLGSFVGTNKLSTELSNTTALQQNISDLTSNFQLTKTGGKSLELNTGNIYQSQLAFSLANFGNDVRGAYLEGNYNRMNDGHGPSTGIRTTPFVQIPDRLRRTVVYGEGAYKPGETVGKDLSTFENIRLPENTIPSELRHLLVTEGTKVIDEFTPIGSYSLSEVPKATKGLKENNELLDQNSFMIFDETKSIDNSTVIGRNANKLPKGTNLSTLSSFTTAYDNVRKNPTKQTQNAFHLENFRIARATFGPFYDESNKSFVPGSPPGSPFDASYGYDQMN